jgi:hypothetical protein
MHERDKEMDYIAEISSFAPLTPVGHAAIPQGE